MAWSSAGNGGQYGGVEITEKDCLYIVSQGYTSILSLVANSSHKHHVCDVFLISVEFHAIQHVTTSGPIATDCT
jgi:hypothetical protein